MTLDQNAVNRLTFLAIKASELAGREILDVYEKPLKVDMKDDNSPLTEADRRAHKAIEAALLESGLPMLSEEGRDIPYEERSRWEYYWLIDPLDGTKEFIKRNGEFTVNIALVHRQDTLAGVIYVPVKDTLYFGNPGLGSYKVEQAQTHLAQTLTDDSLSHLVEQGTKLPGSGRDRPVTLVGSRSHMSPETESFMKEMETRYGKVDILAVGSSLKLCMIAEGKADFYPRFAPTMEWDTAAGQAIIQAMGGRVVGYPGETNVKYNKNDLHNPWFLARNRDGDI